VTGKEMHARGRAITRIRHAGNAVPDNPPAERAAATRTVAANSNDAADCAELLAMLGLDPGEGRSDRQGSAVPSPGVRGRAVRRRYPTR
jgi:hypothetical protein